MNQAQRSVNLYSEIGRLKAVLLHTPGPEIEAMTPQNAHEALYSDILNLNIVSDEYKYFKGVFEKCTQTYQVCDVLAELLHNQNIAENLVRESCQLEGCDFLADSLLAHTPEQLAHELIEGVPYRADLAPKQFANQAYLLKPLYNLFFTRDAASCVHQRVLINTMAFKVRQRETLLYRAIFSHYFNAETFCAQEHDPQASTEGGDVQIVRDDLLCVGNGIRTNKAGINYLMQAHAHLPKFSIIAQELPTSPDSFIHLDMVFTFLGPHTCMAYEPMIRKTGLFSNMHTTLITNDNGRISHQEFPNILTALKTQGVDLEPVLCGGGDQLMQEREQWHSGANFFALGEDHIIGYRRNSHTIDALDKAGYTILNAKDVVDHNQNPFDYKKCIVTFGASELPRGGGGARCMTCPIQRESTEY